MHPIGWAQSTGVAKIAHGRASLGRQLRQNTRIFGPLGRLVKKKALRRKLLGPKR